MALWVTKPASGILASVAAKRLLNLALAAARSIARYALPLCAAVRIEPLWNLKHVYVVNDRNLGSSERLPFTPVQRKYPASILENVTRSTKLEKIKTLSGVKLNIDTFAFTTYKCLGVLRIIFKARYTAVLHQS